MKKLPVVSKTVFFGVSLVALMLVFSSCSKKMTFNSSYIVPAAVGSVKIKSDDNKNQTIDVSVKHLAPSTKLSPPQNTYVVWMMTERNGTQNIGQLNSSTSLLSKTLKASLKTVTSYNPISFFITAEENGNVQYPGTTVVLNTR